MERIDPGADTASAGALGPGDAGAGGRPVGVVVALCAGHRCEALSRLRGDDGLAAAVARSGQGVLISTPCLQQCAHGSVGAVALRTADADVTGPSVWLGGLDDPGRLAALGRWVEHWEPPAPEATRLPEELDGTVLGTGAPLRLTRTGP